MSSQAVTPNRLAVLILPVCVAGFGVLVAAGYSFATTPHSGRELIGFAALVAAATLAERFPVPINAESGGGVVSLTFVFAVATIVLYGWAAGALLLMIATAAIHLVQHRPFQRIAFNVSVLAIVALAAGALIAPIDDDTVGELLARVLLAATADSIINIVLISGAIALSTGQRYAKLVATNVRATIVPFAFMASTSTTSRASTTASATRRETASCSRSPAGFARAARHSASAATSSRCFSSTTTSRRHWRPRSRSSSGSARSTSTTSAPSRSAPASRPSRCRGTGGTS